MEGILYLLQEFKGKVVLFGISDVVDIAIMAFLIYKVIMLMRRTNSGAVAKGVLLLLFALGVSTFFHLNTVSYLLQQLMVWGVVALVVIFQPRNPPLSGADGPHQPREGVYTGGGTQRAGQCHHSDGGCLYVPFQEQDRRADGV